MALLAKGEERLQIKSKEDSNVMDLLAKGEERVQITRLKQEVNSNVG